MIQCRFTHVCLIRDCALAREKQFRNSRPSIGHAAFIFSRPESTSLKNLIYILEFSRSFSLFPISAPKRFLRESRNFRIFQYFVTDSPGRIHFDVGFSRPRQKVDILAKYLRLNNVIGMCGSFNTLTSTDVTLTTSQEKLTQTRHRYVNDPPLNRFLSAPKARKNRRARQCTQR